MDGADRADQAQRDNMLQGHIETTAERQQDTSLRRDNRLRVHRDITDYDFAERQQITRTPWEARVARTRSLNAHREVGSIYVHCVRQALRAFRISKPIHSHTSRPRRALLKSNNPANSAREGCIAASGSTCGPASLYSGRTPGRRGRRGRRTPNPSPATLDLNPTRSEFPETAESQGARHMGSPVRMALGGGGGREASSPSRPPPPSREP